MSSRLHIGNPTHPADPYPVIPVYSTHSASSSHHVSSQSIGIQGVRGFSETRMTPLAGSSEGPLMRHIASTNESSEQPTQGKKWRRTTIKRLSEDTLLEIFDFYRLDEKSWLLLWERQRPWKWHRLAHVCQKWRHVIFTSPRRLDLRILCNSGAPVRSILKSWPTLPLVVRFHASRTSESMPRNVMVALRYPDRLCEIDLDVTSSMTGSIVESIQKPCQALESIRITVKDATGPSILARNAFLGGSAPHLRKVKLDGIAFPFPEIRQVLLSTNNLVELHLSNIPDDVYFSPDDLVTGLFILVQLKRLTRSLWPESISLLSATSP
ncbi:hypothetical protein DFH94DRAFT_192685 [Russula ochroleuca]|uniref:F-box domain-containing protein n=1 Tax=Russula ochroleuca TaxID=152965 RepID=A0A9P5JZD8_9AGAM|nr:hypothetical protein DFH94DRAFT_192685 [Russula ochroleuca]